MPKWKNVKIRQELLEQVEKELQKGQKGERLPSLSEFVSDAIRLRVETMTKERVREYLEREKQSTTAQIQEQRYYTSKHVWARLTPQGTVQLGVSDYFPRQLIGIVYVETGPIGEKVTKDTPFGVVETVAGWPFVIHDMHSPIEGEIVKVNQEVIDDAYVLNGDPYKWIVEIQPSNPEIKKELEALLSFEEYQKELPQN